MKLRGSYSFVKKGLLFLLFLISFPQLSSAAPYDDAIIIGTTPYSSDFLEIEKAEAVDDYTFRVHYKRPFVPGLSSWGISILPKHLLSGKKTLPKAH